jgi:protoporphyrin/coproporphyrin ferrochelatase
MTAQAQDLSQQPSGHPKVANGRVGVLLVNLGTPSGCDTASVRKYLSEFLSDRRVIELHPLLWQPILHGIILRTRPRKSAHAYAQVWDHDRNESPLMAITRAQSQALQSALGDAVLVDYAMRYGSPSIDSRLRALQQAGCDRILLAPLYPQYSAATTASVQDEAFRTLAKLRWQPALRCMPAYYDEPSHIDALARSVQSHVAGLEWQPDLLLISFHGMPRETLDKGDPYHCQCQKTARLLREALGWPKERIRTVFQSRFGPKEWLKPYAADTVASLPSEGVKRLAVLSPGFSADCLETLEEVRLGLAETFTDKGGEAFSYIPCLNDSPVGMAMLEGLIRRELAGWLA